MFILLVLLVLTAASVCGAARPPEGIWGGALLPISAGNSSWPADAIVWPQLEKTVDALIASGIDGIYTSGTAEELWTLTDDEFIQLGDLVSSRAQAAGLAFQIGCSHPSPQVSLRRVEIAVQRWPHALALQVALPDWFPVQNAEAAEFLERIHAALGGEHQGAAALGLVLYNPGNAKRILAPVDLMWSSNLTRYLTGLKVVDKDEGWYASMRTVVRDYANHTGGRRLSVGVPGHHLATGVVGEGVATCSYSNVAALSPVGAARWWGQIRSSAATDRNAALRLEQRIGDFFQRHVVPVAAAGYSDMALDKLLAVAGDWVPGGWVQVAVTRVTLLLARRKSR